jgi:hypothetical protein
VGTQRVHTSEIKRQVREIKWQNAQTKLFCAEVSVDSPPHPRLNRSFSSLLNGQRKAAEREYARVKCRAATMAQMQQLACAAVGFVLGASVALRPEHYRKKCMVFGFFSPQPPHRRALAWYGSRDAGKSPFARFPSGGRERRVDAAKRKDPPHSCSSFRAPAAFLISWALENIYT